MLEDLFTKDGKWIQSFTQFDSYFNPAYKDNFDAIHFPIIGYTLPLHEVFIDEKKALLQVESAIRTYWQSMNLFTLQDIAAIAHNVEWVNNRLQQFFESKSNMQKLYQYLLKNQRMNYSQFLSIVLEKDILVEEISNGLSEIIVLNVGDQYIVQAMREEYQTLYELLLAKKIYTVLVKKPVHFIHHLPACLKLFKQILQKHYTKNRVASIIHQLVTHIDYENKKSFELKQLHLFNILTHASSGKRSLKRLKKCIGQFEAQFLNGEYAITDKETVLLHYLLFYRAIQLHLSDEKLYYAYALTKDSELNNFAVEIFFDIEEVFPVIGPNPTSLVKYYPSYYLEFIYYHIIHTFVEAELYKEAYEILCTEEIASCTAIYEVLNGDRSTEALAQIEATVQRDILEVYRLPAAKMMEAISEWHSDYQRRSSKSYAIASYTGRHVINILKTIFVCDELDCFEKLLEVYKKYLHIPSATEQLHQFLIEQIEEKSSQLT